MNRRGFLRRGCAASTAGVAVLAGCSGSGGGGRSDGGGGRLPGEDYPAVHAWLTEDDVNRPEGSYDGTILDARGTDPVRVDVGAEGNGGDFSFDPAGVAVSPGTTVRWVWTGTGPTHNVVADPEAQPGEAETDYTFSSGRPAGAGGTEFSYGFGEPGVALYHCEPHVVIGAKGAIAVTE